MSRPSAIPRTGGSMSMAQDTNFRHLRSDESSSRDPVPAERNNDPLAELARLIGQEDPFASLGRQGGRASSPSAATQPHADDPHAAPEWLARPGPHATGPVHHDQSPAEPHDHLAAGYEAAPYQHDQRYDEPHDPNEAYAADGYYDDNQPYEEGYDAPPPAKRRGGLMTVAAVIGLAL